MHEPNGSDKRRSKANITVIHEDELERQHRGRVNRFEEEGHPMTVGEIITLLIAIGVLIYLVYALLWPDRF